jgi:hypothetical protein
MAMYKYKDVEAQQLLAAEGDNESNAGELAEWSGGEETWAPDGKGGLKPQLVINTRLGTRVANAGDYVVKLSEKSFMVVSQRDFEEQYEEVGGK